MPHLSNFLFFCDSGVLHWKQMTSADEPPPSALSPDKETKEKGKKLAEWCANHQFIGAPVTHFCPVLARPWAPRLVNHPECRSFYPWLKTEKTVSWRQTRPTAGAEWKVSFNLGFGYDLSGLIRAKHHSFHHGGGDVDVDTSQQGHGLSGVVLGEDLHRLDAFQVRNVI